jgi:hypothetical protein
MNPSLKSVCVPKLLWDELESALMIKSKELIRDIAKTLHQSETILLQEFRGKKTSLCLLELERDNEEMFQCCALDFTTPIAHRCRKPVAYGMKFCPSHEFFLMPSDLSNKPRVQRIQGEEVFVDSLTQQVFTVHQERIGYINNNKCFLFEIEEG